MIDQRLGIDIVYILNLSRMKSVYVVLYSIPSQTLNVEKIHMEWNEMGLSSISVRRSLSEGWIRKGTSV